MVWEGFAGKDKAASSSSTFSKLFPVRPPFEAFEALLSPSPPAPRSPPPFDPSASKVLKVHLKLGRHMDNQVIDFIFRLGERLSVCCHSYICDRVGSRVVQHPRSHDSSKARVQAHAWMLFIQGLFYVRHNRSVSN